MAGTGRKTGGLGEPSRAEPLYCWLPALAHFERGHPVRAWLARADRLPAGGSGYLGGLGDYFGGVDADVAAGAITREFLHGDAGEALWLSADPAWVQPDMNGVRLLACGQLQLGMDEALALAEPLRAVFEEADMQLVVSAPDHWHLRLAPDTPLPKFAAPEQALGEDLSQHLPAGAQGRRWRVLLNDIQILLHQHPLNAVRRGRGLSPVNSLWLWGGGRLPPPASTRLRGVASDDLLLSALAARAGVVHQPRAIETCGDIGGGWLLDLQDLAAGEIASAWSAVLQDRLQHQSVILHFAGGERWQRKPWHRWRMWRGAGR